MRSLNLTVNKIVVLLFLKRLNLGFGQNYSRFRGQFFECLQSQLEVMQITAKPDRPHAERRNKRPEFAEFIAGSGL